MKYAFRSGKNEKIIGDLLNEFGAIIHGVAAQLTKPRNKIKDSRGNPNLKS
ncbi:MAG: hypothetical protein ACTSR8_01120 [Promethearchaeota archaeon]